MSSLFWIEKPIVIAYRAGVAELADAHDSKSCARKGMRVRLPPSAPYSRKSNNMKFLLRPAELALKLGNREFFERQLERNIISAFKGSKTNIKHLYGSNLLETNIDEKTAIEKLTHIIGIANFSIVKTAPQDLGKISEIMTEEIKKRSDNLKNSTKTFCVRINKIQKTFPMRSPEIEAKLGEMILRKFPKLKVKLDAPDITCRADFVNDKAFVYFDKIEGLSGLPIGSSGKIVSLISSGIDSPVASFRMMKRGAKIIFAHFHSYPQTNRQSIENVRDIVKILAQYQGESKIYFMPFLEIQKAVMMIAPPDLRVILYRRFMIKIAEKIAEKENAGALATGESLGQVASQTIDNIKVVNEAAGLPVFRPLIGHNKQEIVDEARKLGTYEISIRPYADCCTLFVPKHPTTKANLEEVKKVEKKPIFKRLIADIFKIAEIENIV